MTPIVEVKGNKYPSVRMSVDLPSISELVDRGRVQGVEALKQLAKKWSLGKSRLQFSIQYRRSEPAKYIVANSGTIEKDFYHTKTVLVVTKPPRRVADLLPRIKYVEQEHDFLGHGDANGAFVTTDVNGNDIMVFPLNVLADALITGAIAHPKIIDGSYHPSKVMSRNHIPTEDILPLYAGVFPLDKDQLSYYQQLEANKFSS